jgi:hypothetical protein
VGEKFTFTIKRSAWLRGDPENSRLLRASDGKKCCLGFYCLAVGVPKKAVRATTSPARPNVHPILPLDAKWLVNRHNRPLWPKASPDCYDLMRVNDDPYINDAEREKEIRRLFAKHDVRVKFVP